MGLSYPIPESKNVETDHESRVFHENTEWVLSPAVFQLFCERLFSPQVDLLASKLNHKVPSYVAWRPNPKAVAIDAFAISWTGRLFFAFAPISLITRVLRKIREDKLEGILVAPLWETQPWFPLLIKVLIVTPLILPYKVQKLHLLRTKLRLIACHLSGNYYRTLCS